MKFSSRQSGRLWKIFPVCCLGSAPSCCLLLYLYFNRLAPSHWESQYSFPEVSPVCLELEFKGKIPQFVPVPLQRSKHQQKLQSFATLMRSFPWCGYKKAMEQKNLTQIQDFSEQLFNTILIPFVIAESPVPVNESCEAPPLFGVEAGTKEWNCSVLSKPRKVGVLVNFGFDVDALEVHLHELDSVVDYFFLMEGLKPHSGIIATKPSIWDMVMHTPRFCRFRHKIVHFIVDDAGYSQNEWFEKHPKLWDRENLQSRLRLQKLLEWNNATGYFGPEDLIGIGDTDEIPNRDAINILKHCEIHDTSGAVSIGIWFPYPYEDTIFASDFPVAPKRHDYTLGNPTYWIWAAFEKLLTERGSDFLGRRPKNGSPGTYLLGGMHFSAYPYLPYQMIKLLTSTKEGLAFQGIKKVIDVGTKFLDTPAQGKHNDSNSNDDGQNVDVVAQKKIIENYVKAGARFRVMSLKKFRKKHGDQEADSIVKVPWFYKCNPGRYASFRKKIDLRLNGVF